MFVCYDCAPKNQLWRFMSNIMISVGNCECCKKHGECIEIDRAAMRVIDKAISLRDRKKLVDDYLNDPLINQMKEQLYNIYKTAVPKKLTVSLSSDVCINGIGEIETSYDNDTEIAIIDITQKLAEYTYTHYPELTK